GNAPAHYVLSGDDDERKIDYQFGTDQVTVIPGEGARVPLAVSTRRHWLGRAQHLPFQVHAHAAGRSVPLSIAGEFVNKARLSVWFLPITLVVFIIAVSLIYAFGALPYRSSTPPLTVGPTATPTLNWTARNSGTDMYLLGITSSGSQFVAVGYSG